MEADGGPAHRQPRRSRVGGQARGESGHEVLIAALSRAGAEDYMVAARAAGQLARPAGVARGDRHHPRGRSAAPDPHLAAVPGNDVIAA